MLLFNSPFILKSSFNVAPVSDSMIKKQFHAMINSMAHQHEIVIQLNTFDIWGQHVGQMGHKGHLGTTYGTIGKEFWDKNC